MTIRRDMGPRRPNPRDPRSNRGPSGPARKDARGRRVVPVRRKNPLPLILGGVGGFFLLLVIIIVAASSGGTPEKMVIQKREAPSVVPVSAPDVSALEREGRAKCEAGFQEVPGLKAQFAAASEERKQDILPKLVDKLRLMKEGLELLRRANGMITEYNQAAGKSMKKLEYGSYEQLWKTEAGLLASQLEKDAQSSCQQGLAAIKSLEAKMSAALSDAEKHSLKAALKEAMDQISHGMSLYDYIYQINGQLFDTKKYGEARKLASSKYHELQ
ncbi:MAG: hypothetical protein HY716_10970 [Planctomycetes bacterium]|nr:hypothetical protein [Planctomycetota bacterium]